MADVAIPPPPGTRSARPTVQCTTIVVPGAMAADALRIDLARRGAVGTLVTSVDGMAARLAGGFCVGIDPDELHDAVRTVLEAMPSHELSDLASLAGLPGLPSAIAASLMASWQAGLDLSSRASASGHKRLVALSHIEAAALARLPPSRYSPAKLVERALDRLEHAPAVVGTLVFQAVSEIDSCWRALIVALARTIPTCWIAGPRAVPQWVRDAGLSVKTTESAIPRVEAISYSSARHEVMEAFRWGRDLLARGVPAADIGIAAAAPGDYDDLVLALASEANIDVHFAHGRRVLASRSGQACAALASLLLHGLDRDRMVRFVRAVGPGGGSLVRLPENWQAFVPHGQRLDSVDRWRRACESSGMPEAAAGPLLRAIDVVARGPEAARDSEALLGGASKSIWQRCLMRAPFSAIENTLYDLRAKDDVEPATSIVWQHANALAAAPRKHVWLFGLNSRTWPRRSREDPLLPDHIVPHAELQPQTITAADRVSFEHILLTTETHVYCSFSRRDATGRRLGVSPLLPDVPVRTLHQARVPEHPMSEPDRLMSHPREFASTHRAASTEACWQNWNRPHLTPHDGAVRSGHSVIAASLKRVQSTTSLKTLLRNPLGYLWKYALRWESPDLPESGFDLDATAFGNLVHAILHAASVDLEDGPGLAQSSGKTIENAVGAATAKVAVLWREQQDLPPRLLWEQHLERARQMAVAALAAPISYFSGQRTFLELSFPQTDEPSPWRTSDAVFIPGTPFLIAGRIDRLDLSPDGLRARVIDYKTGKAGGPVVLNGGRELQRCLYAFAATALLDADVKIEAALLFPHGGDTAYRPLNNHAGVLATLTTALVAAHGNLSAGQAFPGADAGEIYDDYLFALPGYPGSAFFAKRAVAQAQLGAAADIWDAE